MKTETIYRAMALIFLAVTVLAAASLVYAIITGQVNLENL